jgi:hypothetical protein
MVHPDGGSQQALTRRTNNMPTTNPITPTVTDNGTKLSEDDAAAALKIRIALATARWGKENRSRKDRVSEFIKNTTGMTQAQVTRARNQMKRRVTVTMTFDVDEMSPSPNYAQARNAVHSLFPSKLLGEVISCDIVGENIPTTPRKATAAKKTAN